MEKEQHPIRAREGVLIFGLLFILIRTLLGFWTSLSATTIDTQPCPGYAEEVSEAIGVQEGQLAICRPDRQYATVGLVSNSALVLDMGKGNETVDIPGIDIYYYERPQGPGIFLDQVEISIAPEDEKGEPSSRPKKF